MEDSSRIGLVADAPYISFLTHVREVEPLEESALEETGWLDRLHRGKIVHDTLEAFVSEIGGRPPRREDEELLLEILDGRLDRFKEQLSPPNAAIERADRHRLREDLRVFLRSELAREEPFETRHQELGFGLGPRRTREGDRSAPVTLALGEDLSIRLRGRIDRIDRLADGSLIVWDYKTGSRRRFSEGDPLQAGTTVQWALYAAAAEQLVDAGGGVRASGYFFTSVREMGERLVFPPAAHERELEAVVRRLAELPRTGSFPMHHKAAVWGYGGFDRICPDPRARGRELSEKRYPEDRPRPPHLDEN
jgi:ATP-dependent helicase/DNAse subunit B